MSPISPLPNVLHLSQFRPSASQSPQAMSEGRSTSVFLTHRQAWSKSTLKLEANPVPSVPFTARYSQATLTARRRYTAWDKAFEEQRAPDYTFLAARLSTIGIGPEENPSSQSEYLWRKCACTLASVATLDWTVDQDQILIKIALSTTYASKALQSNASSFGANLWMAKCLAPPLMLNTITSPTNRKQLREHLAVAASIDADNWRVLLLQAQVLADLFEPLRELHVGSTGRLPAVPSLLPPANRIADLQLAEAKLCRALEQSVNCHEIYLSLAMVLLMLGNATDALQVAKEGVQLGALNKGEEWLAEGLKRFIRLLDSEVFCKRGRFKQKCCCCSWW